MMSSSVVVLVTSLSLAQAAVMTAPSAAVGAQDNVQDFVDYHETQANTAVKQPNADTQDIGLPPASDPSTDASSQPHAKPDRPPKKAVTDDANPWPAALLGLGGACAGTLACGGIAAIPLFALGMATEGTGAIFGSPIVGAGTLVGAGIGSAIPALVFSQSYSGTDIAIIIIAPAVLAGLLGTGGAFGAAALGTILGNQLESEIAGGAIGLSMLSVAVVLAGVSAGLAHAGLALLVTGDENAEAAKP